VAKKPSIFIIEDHPAVCDALVSYLEGTGVWQISGTASSLEKTKELFAHNKSDILLLDIQLEDGLGLNIIPWLKQCLNQNEVLPIIAVYSAFDDFVHVSAALGMGVKVYMCKRRSVKELEQALLKALDGVIYIDDTVQAKLNIAADKLSLLTKREAQILSMVSGGLSDREIAKNLGISFRTVQNILYCVFDKTGIRSRFELQKL